MIIELNTKLLDIPGVNSNQLIFLSLVLDKNQKTYNQDVRKVVSLTSDEEISNLISQGLITSIERGKSITYSATDKLKEIAKPNRDYFDLFYEMYPIYVLRPDGTKNYLRANINKCKRLFNSYVGRSEAMAQHLIQCLDFEMKKKANQGKLGYMKTMWRWLVDHQWEESEEEMQDESKQEESTYGTELI
jgi:hypothetical protein